jgi:NAD(P)H-hydrate repair Nnr-like enzyme with NAD(P)H-hydrate dehydratase domain
MPNSFWQKQQPAQPLFPDIEWNRPEQRRQAGKLAIIGGNKLGFVAVATAYQEATELGVGQVRAILPDALKPAIPTTILDTVYVPSNTSGGMSREAGSLVLSGLVWADHALLIGDTGRNSETAMIYESLLATDRPLTITRDAIDLLKNASMAMISRPSTTLVVSFAQLQKLFQAVYYPKMLSFSMQLSLLVDTLHKFTISYPCIIVTYHQNQLVVAHNGQVITQEFDQPMLIWRGTVATRTACYQLWAPRKQLESVVCSMSNI